MRVPAVGFPDDSGVRLRARAFGASFSAGDACTRVFGRPLSRP